MSQSASPPTESASLVARLEAEGTFIDEGHFSVDWPRALELLGGHAAADAGEWLPLILQIGGMLGATRMDVSCRGWFVEVRWTGVVLSRNDLIEPWMARGTLHKLAVAYAVALTQGADAIEVTASGLRARYSGREVEVDTVPTESSTSHDSTCIRVDLAGIDIARADRLRDLVTTRCGFSNVLVHVEADIVSRGWAAGFDGRTVDVRTEDGLVIGMAGYTLAPAVASLEVLVGGVQIETIELVGYEEGFVAIVDLDIELDLSHRKVVRGQAFERLLGWIGEAAGHAPRCSEQDRAKNAAWVAQLERDGEIINDDVFCTTSGDALDRADLPANDSEWLPILIQAASLLGARVVKTWGHQGLGLAESDETVYFDGPEFTLYELCHPWRALDMDANDPRRNALHKFAVALSMLVLAGYGEIMVSTSAHQARYVGRRVCIHSTHRRGTIVLATRRDIPRFAESTRIKPGRARVAGPREHEPWSLATRVKHSCMAIWDESNLLSHGWASLFDVVPYVDVLDAKGRTIGAAGFLAGSREEAEAHVYVGGVLIERVSLASLKCGFVAIVDVDLPLDGSQRRLMNCEGYASMLHAIAVAHDAAPRPTEQQIKDIRAAREAADYAEFRTVFLIAWLCMFLIFAAALFVRC